MTGEFPPLSAFSKFSTCHEPSYKIKKKKKKTLKKCYPYNQGSRARQCCCLLCSAPRRLGHEAPAEPSSVSLTRFSPDLCLPIATRTATCLPLKRERVIPDQKTWHEDSSTHRLSFAPRFLGWRGHSNCPRETLPTLPTIDLVEPGDHREGSGSPQVSQEQREP